MTNMNQIISSGKITNKQDFYKLFENGVFGNKPLAWDTYQEIIESGWKGDICIRGKNVKSFQTIYDIPLEEATKKIEILKKQGIFEKDLSFNQSLPNHLILIQAELQRTQKGLYLLYSEVKKPMKLAFQEKTSHAFGLKALEILKHTLTPQSYSDIETLWNIFPNSIIEIGAYNTCIGNLPGRNTLIWEVRDY